MNSATHNVDVGSRVKKARVASGHTQQDFAVIIGCSRSNIAQIEAGRCPISGMAAAKIAAVAKVSTDWLLTGNGRGPTLGASAPAVEVHAHVA